MSAQLNIFHNTIHLKGESLSDALAKAVMQNHKVYVVMQYKKMATPSQVHGYFPASVPFTSIRRAMNTLTLEGKLEKTLMMRDGPMGKPEHVWRLVW